MKRFQDWKFLAAMVMTASVVAMTAVVCAKSVSVLFKLDKAQHIHIFRNCAVFRKFYSANVEEDEDLFGI